ncbi:MAG: flavodoxin-dependent (E)-4-hydroxy-3-methylbut-2-enyl-diphosphate synthase [Corallococcus sp.]|nr:flavodoxin-dependent (E)-4-hydroxy-3-methylbut-2-enyl-diphosphate synthase [Corallococcus sp.]MCM1359730.1 flavodoxin-dependent (E)-4-hydroxy-3-methylbut-2-enyl-diphosphate synthase [Corallococcus sp.]MCM1395439.1 flavodoxin-dependent (E)-4-hydroxy-3-methylbut-2-enyl-diphosphate synthase [Corallococcus sp.]
MKKLIEGNNNLIFGDGRITVQSMTNLPVTDVDGTAEQIRSLILSGCDIVRIAVPNLQHVLSFAKVRQMFPTLPLVADIHFDARLAVAAIEAGCDKIRLNPGNVPQTQLDRVIDCAKSHNALVRLGVNGGSVNRDWLARCGGDKAQALVESLGEFISLFERRGFYSIVLSAKSSDVKETVKLNRMIFDRFSYPIHLGVTEAGPAPQGVIKNAIGIGSLLLDGIGDTIRVSLTGNPVDEVIAAKEILRFVGLKQGVEFVSCPKCGRCSIDLEAVAAEIYDYVKDIDKPVKIAVMGCEVNGPGECADADLGLAGMGGKFVFFKKGARYKTVDASDGVQIFKKEIDMLLGALK